MIGTHQLRLLQLLGEVDEVALVFCCACLSVGQMRPCHPGVTGCASCMHHAKMQLHGLLMTGVCTSAVQPFTSLGSGGVAGCQAACQSRRSP